MSEFSESDSDCPAQVFPVPKSDTDNPPDPQRALTSPEGYIHFVRHEAESYPSVICAPPPIDESQSNAMSVPEKVTSPRTYSTEQENNWLNLFIESVEVYSTRSCDEISLGISVLQERFAGRLRTKRILLKFYTRSLFLIRLRLTSQQLTSSTLFDGVPSLSWMAVRSRVELDTILELLASQCTRKRWKSPMSTWIFALLVAQEKPVYPDTCHTLRTIAKRCAKLKQELGGTLSETETQLFDLFPYLMAKVFGQLDLID
ncbi:hypothetical protein FBUS_03020 [Fasciolopsis buskii]|uniref:Gem-associated protein 2 n=1 Tax=Fasciolopsis buskii TaxID=27845 RepID=A0A8E0RTA5_9TREM|nr:hypothetical protein FBUS_03020 [Fasciolopsis buski]